MDQSTEIENKLVRVENFSYDSINIIARGYFAIVFKGFHHKDGKELAIKRTELIRVRHEFVQKIISKDSFLRVSDHPNILRYYSVGKTEDFL